jgi:hypothetical protein
MINIKFGTLPIITLLQNIFDMAELIIENNVKKELGRLLIFDTVCGINCIQVWCRDAMHRVSTSANIVFIPQF